MDIVMEESLMFSYVWPIALVVLSNVVYQICSKSIPEGMNPFASLTVTYLVGAVASSILFFVFDHGGNLIHEVQKMNWAPLALGIVIVGLEAGWIYAYRAGWQVSTGFIVHSAFLAVALILVGYMLYNEAVTWNKLVGVCFCIIGLAFINLK
jgi:drug/metabolite transporter (DMT)-like permease